MLASCYPQPDISLQVSRSDPDQNVALYICDPSFALCTPEQGLNVFDRNPGLTQLVSIFVENDASHAVVDLTYGTGTHVCFDVMLADGTLERAFDIGQTEPWSCPTTPCESPLPACRP